MISDLKSLDIKIFTSREKMGNAAGSDVESKIIEILKVKSELRMIFAAAPSQNELLDYLAASQMIEWNRIIAFHMDEYIGLPDEASQLFSEYLNNRLFKKVLFKEIHLINGQNYPAKEAARYAEIIKQVPIDIICLGIGENGHIAFNDPSVADFNDMEIVKEVELDKSSRLQQVNEGCFSTLEQVPERALTITIPTIMKANFLFCVVPGKRKHNAVYKTLYGPIENKCPATVLRTHHACKFYFDTDSFY